MIKLENYEVVGWEHAIRGMRNPMNSWAKSDGGYTCGDHCCNLMPGCDLACDIPHYVVGPNDLALMTKLAKAGTDHRKFMRYIDVYVDITAPFYWWKEFKTYRRGRKFMDDDEDILEPWIETNSCSTMHKITEKEFTLDDFSHEHLSGENVSILLYLVDILNRARRIFVDGWKGVPGDDAINIEPGNKTFWWQMIQLLPSSYNQLRTVKLNYEVLARMYHARKNHKLDEWRDFCKWIETLPYSEIITCGASKEVDHE